jgi:1-acyl-sn-glycerol-3-phosphate acyltransferase
VRLSTNEIERRVAEVAATVLDEVPEPDRRVAADSLTQAELALALEEAFGTRLPDDVSLPTLGDAADAVVAALGREVDGAAALGPGIGRFQGLVQGALSRPLSWAYRLRVEGADHVPPWGPAVLASNHDSLLDIPFLVIATPRPVWFMAKVELFRGRLGSTFFHLMGGFPVRRGGYDLQAVRAVLQVLRSGRLLGMYPEGTRSSRLQAFLPGAAWASLATGAPLVPVGVTGTADALPRGSAMPRRSDVSVRFGPPIEVAREEDPRARLERARTVTDDLRSEIEKLVS